MKLPPQIRTSAGEKLYDLLQRHMVILRPQLAPQQFPRQIVADEALKNSTLIQQR